MSDTNLKPCPFCGGAPILKEVGNNRTKGRHAQIKCRNCFAGIQVGALKNTIEWCVEKVIKQWNTREKDI